MHVHVRTYAYLKPFVEFRSFSKVRTYVHILAYVQAICFNHPIPIIEIAYNSGCVYITFNLGKGYSVTYLHYYPCTNTHKLHDIGTYCTYVRISCNLCVCVCASVCITNVNVLYNILWSVDFSSY